MMISIPVTLSFSVQGSNLPFNMEGERATPDRRHQWIDLGKGGGQVRDLPEVRRYPQWEPILRTLNAPECPFQTIGCHCDVREDEPLIKVEGVSPKKQIHQPWLASSYVQIGVAGELGIQSVDVLYVLSGRLMAHLSERAFPFIPALGTGERICSSLATSYVCGVEWPAKLKSRRLNAGQAS